MTPWHKACQILSVPVAHVFVYVLECAKEDVEERVPLCACEDEEWDYEDVCVYVQLEGVVDE